MKMKLSIAFLFIALFFVACTKTGDEPFASGYKAPVSPEEPGSTPTTSQGCLYVDYFCVAGVAETDCKVSAADPESGSPEVKFVAECPSGAIKTCSVEEKGVMYDVSVYSSNFLEICDPSEPGDSDY